ncbi:twin-arginine translocase TatA/TatE family subunit [Collinsella sp. D33t1_170424_A12]|uniref:Sec-independent protein translocase subunit TatA/TatB n=1 Tax=Collinsella sp. D33t1_170424_A12 TaxID=2787135 RepID=UPI00189B1748
MFGISSTELMIIVIFGFLLFGPDKLPQMGRTLGRALRQFRETQEKMTSVVQSEVIDPMAAAAAAPVRPKKSAAEAQASDDDLDADLADGTEAAPRRKETFAERRARLAAEKAQKEQEGGEPGAAASEPAADSVPTVEPEPEEEPAPEAEQIRTTEDLYARRPRKRRAVEAASDADADAASVAVEEGSEN